MNDRNARPGHHSGSLATVDRVAFGSRTPELAATDANRSGRQRSGAGRAEAAASSKYVYLNKPIVVLVADVFKETFLTRVRVKAYVLDPRLEMVFQSDVTERARAGFREAGLLRPRHMLQGLVERSSVGERGDGARSADRRGEKEEKEVVDERA